MKTLDLTTDIPRNAWNCVVVENIIDNGSSVQCRWHFGYKDAGGQVTEHDKKGESTILPSGTYQALGVLIPAPGETFGSAKDRFVFEQGLIPHLVSEGFIAGATMAPG